MNGWQLLRQVKNLLQAATWPDSPGEVVFGSRGVYISSGPSDEGIGQINFPFALISPLDSTADDEEPGLEEQNFNVRLVVRVAGDLFGEAALIGGSRSGGQGSSKGRGLMEVEEELLRIIKNLDRNNGVKIRVNWKSAAQAVMDEDLGYVVSREYLCAGWVGVVRDYPAVSRTVGTDLTGGNAKIDWRLPANRYDRNSIIIRRAVGATPPSSVTDGTGVYDSSLVSTYTDNPGAGTFSYSVFVGYDELGTGTSDRFSLAGTVSGLVVT